MRYKYTKEQLQEIVLTSKSIADVCRKAGLKPAGGNYKTLHYKFKKWGINISHFTGQGWNIGLKFKPCKSLDLSDILVKNSNYQTSRLKKRLLLEGYKTYMCENCKCTSWLNNPIPLELHHINGDKFDHRIENIQLLCPNCHALTDSFRGKNIGLLKK